MSKSFDLKKFQGFMFEDIKTPLDLETFELKTDQYKKENLDQIRGFQRENIDPIYQLSTYNQQYWFRLIASMQEQFPLLLALMGLNDFNQMALRYLNTHPSQEPNLNLIGQNLVPFLIEDIKSCQKKSITTNIPSQLLIECAELECIYNQLFIQEEEPGLSQEKILSQLSDIGQRKLIFKDGVIGLSHTFILYELIEMVRNKIDIKIEVKSIKKQSHSFFVFIFDHRVHFISSHQKEMHLFHSLTSGKSINDSMECLEKPPNETVLKELMAKIAMFNWLKAIK